jgi:chromosome segregation ATPase
VDEEITRLETEVDALRERVHKADGMANEINILTREVTALQGERDAWGQRYEGERLRRLSAEAEVAFLTKHNDQTLAQAERMLADNIALTGRARAAEAARDEALAALGALMFSVEAVRAMAQEIRRDWSDFDGRTLRDDVFSMTQKELDAARAVLASRGGR